MVHEMNEKIQDEILTLDLNDEASAFRFSMLFLDLMTIIKEMETLDGDKSFICSDIEAGYA